MKEDIKIEKTGELLEGDSKEIERIITPVEPEKEKKVAKKVAKKIITREVVMKLLYQAAIIEPEDGEDKNELVNIRIKSIFDELDNYIDNNDDYLSERMYELTGYTMKNNIVDYDFASVLCEALKNNIEIIDSKIEENLVNWTIERISVVDLSILRLCIAEALYVESTPVAVAINEAIKLSKNYSESKSYKFIHGIMGKVCE